MRLRDRLDGRAPRVLLTLGSGLGALADEIQDPLVLRFEDAGLPPPTVPGHAGRLLVGVLADVDVVVQQGRLHLYEGVPARDVAACVRAAAEAGVGTYVVTNAAGGLASDLSAGDLMLLRDHLNLTGTSPLIPDPAFVDMSAPYDLRARAAAAQAAEVLGETLREGVYAGLVGPAYETPAEAAMLRTLGADLVGMSTVVEVIAARAAGLRVLGLSLVTNVHHPDSAGAGTSTAHAEVLDVAAAAGPRLAALVREVLPRLET